ncbi:MAG TPA: FAD:protein FMN transferase [Candidatus Limnocylindrales bacterium]
MSGVAADGVATRRFGGMRVEHIMGTAIGIDVRDPGVDLAAVDAAFEWFRDVDRRFSTYRADSEISRIGSGALDASAASEDVRAILALCDDLTRTTGGAFDATRHRADGSLDPSGVVKGWAVDEAARILEAAGGRNFTINAGGDVVARGTPDGSRGWRVGIRHPRIADRVAAVLEVSDRAVATSADYERPGHIRDPRRDGGPASGGKFDLLSMTVVGPSLTWADAYATAAFVMGEAGAAWVAERPGYGAIAITTDDRVIWTPEADALRA